MEEKRYEVSFKYRDALSKWEWREQSCSLYGTDERDAIEKCKKLYGLGVDCDYEIIGVKEGI